MAEGEIEEAILVARTHIEEIAAVQSLLSLFPKIIYLLTVIVHVRVDSFDVVGSLRSTVIHSGEVTEKAYFSLMVLILALSLVMMHKAYRKYCRRCTHADVDELADVPSGKNGIDCYSKISHAVTVLRGKVNVFFLNCLFNYVYVYINLEIV